MGAHAALVVRRPARSLVLSIINIVDLRFLHGFIFLLLAIWLLSYSSGSGGGQGGIIIAAAAGGGGSGSGDSSLRALINFKSSLKNVDALSNWDRSSKTNPCAAGSGESWTGVLCYSGNVWGLQLEKMGLGGNIDIDSLLSLPQLRTLSFMHNKFEGPLPDFRKLGALKSLFLSDNLFSGDIPDDAFMGMSYLKKVHLANNNFTGYIPTSLAKSPRLLELKLENNQFVGPIPDFPPDLKFINVSNNQLEGPIPPLLSDVDATSFSGNRKLCGKPLGTACTSPSPTVNSSDGPPTEAKRAEEEKPSSLRMVVMVIAGLVGLAAMVVVLIACCRQIGGRSKYGDVGATPLSSTSQRGKRDNHGICSNGGGSGNVRSCNGSVRDQHGRLTFVREDRQRFELQDLLRASAEVLGSGSFGSSYKAVLMDPEGQAVVVKRFKQMNKVAREDFQEHMRRLGRLSHPNLLPIVAYYYRKEEKLLVFDYIPKGSLASQLHGNHSPEQPGLDWPARLKIIKGVAKGLAYLHSELPSLNVPHGHLKSANVLVGTSFVPLLMDYALVPVVNPEQAQQLMVAYKSPEYCQHGLTNKKTDVWSLGILILETLTCKFPSNYLPNTTSIAASPLPRGNSTAYQYLTNNNSSSSSWVKSIIPNASLDQLENEKQLDHLFDKEMGSSIKNARGEMLKLLRIGIACCEDDLENRLDLKKAVEKIDLINERDQTT